MEKTIKLILEVVLGIILFLMILFLLYLHFNPIFSNTQLIVFGITFIILGFLLILLIMVEGKIKAKCSNCGKESEYSESEWQGRENTECKSCGHTLSVTGGFLE